MLERFNHSQQQQSLAPAVWRQPAEARRLLQLWQPVSSRSHGRRWPALLPQHLLVAVAEAAALP